MFTLEVIYGILFV